MQSVHVLSNASYLFILGSQQWQLATVGMTGKYLFHNLWVQAFR